MDDSFDWSRVLFVGFGDGVEGVNHYRIALPALTLGAEYVVFDDNGNGIARYGSNMKHDVIVIQHCWKDWQLRIARNMRKMGAKTLINVDDWLPGVANLGKSHAFSQHFASKELMRQYWSLLREADGVLAATPWLQDRLQSRSNGCELARNGLDLARYQKFPKEAHDGVVIGWAGGTGHVDSFAKTIPALCEAMDEHDDVRVHIVGDDLHSLFPREYKTRVVHRPWSHLTQYPRNLAEFDISLAPASDNDFYRAKSQLRFYEACAMGTLTIADAMYDELDDGCTGFIATDWTVELLHLLNKRHRIVEMGNRAAEYAQEISIEQRIGEWKTAIMKLTSL
jgi:glycosyltransferase involved in cell wall biosynthesis